MTERQNDGQAENSLPPKLRLQGGGGGYKNGGNPNIWLTHLI